MALDLQILRTAKAALDEGLLNTADYDSMKASFIKAQSIKAGVEAGFISQTDYAEARAAFFSGLGMPVGGAVAAVAPSHSTPPQAPTSQGNGTTRSFKAPPPGQPQPSNTAIATAEPPASAPVKATRVPSQQPTEAVPSDRTIPPLSLPDPQTQAEACSTPTTDGSKSASLVPTPTGLSDRGGKNAAADKKSMAGIRVNPDSVNIVWEVNIKKTYRWVSYHIGTTGKEVEIEKVGARTASWDAFISELPADQCRYGVFDYEYTNSDGTTFGKLCFVSWAPDTAPVKAKMQHASTKDLFRSMLEGIAVEMNATEKGDLSESTLREKVKTTVAKK